MLKAHISYSKKVPVDGLDFSSQGYSLTLETEIPESDPRQIQARVHETFEMVKATVEQELANGNGTGNGNGNAQPQSPVNGSGATNGQRSTGVDAKASNKQIKYLTDLATQKGISLSDLNADVQRRFGVSGIYDLSRRNASALLDEIKDRRQAA